MHVPDCSSCMHLATYWRLLQACFLCAMRNSLLQQGRIACCLPRVLQATFGTRLTLLRPLQLALAYGRRSVLPAGVGLAAGVLHQINFLGLRHLSLRRLLRPIQAFLGRAPVSINVAGHSSAQQQRQRQHRGAGASGAGSARSRGRRAPAAVSESRVAQLVEMGFDGAAARAALQQHGNDVSRALSALVS